jgi:hypothetical protein
MAPIFRRSDETPEPEPEELDLPAQHEEPDDSQLAGRLEIYSAAPLIQDLHGEPEGDTLADAEPLAAAPTPGPARGPARIDVGTRVAEVLHAAESAAEGIVADAGAEADRLRAAALEELERARTAAEQLRGDAETYAESTRAKAHDDAESLRRDVQGEVAAMRSEAAAEAQALREDGELIRDQLAREGLARQRQLAEATHSLEEQLGTALGAVRGIAAELDELLAREQTARSEDESLVEVLGTNWRGPRQRRSGT